MNMKIMDLAYVVAIFCSIIGLPAASATRSTRTGQCYGLPTYSAIKTGDYQCRLWQPNWASETIFELNFKHCQENPTINLFIRNFYGADEVNTDFNPQYRKRKFILYTGKEAQFIIVFKPVKASPKNGIRAQVRILVIFKPDYYLPDQQQLLTGVFYTDMKDDCNVFEKMSPHTQIFLSLGLIIGFVLLPIAVFIFFKWRRTQGEKKEKRKPFFRWLFKWDKKCKSNNIEGENEHELNGDAPTKRLI